MFKRLFVLLLLVAATVSASTPAHASTLSVSLSCYQTSADVSGWNRSFACYANASGGSPNYTFQWYHTLNGGTSFVYQETNGGTSQVGDLQCNTPHTSTTPSSGTARVVVTDSAGAQVSVTRTTQCYHYVP